MFKPALGMVPEVQGAVEAAFGDQRYVAKTFIQYIRVAERLANLSEEEIEIISGANSILASRGASRGSASHINGETFLQNLGEDRRSGLRALLLGSTNILSDNFTGAIDDLTRMMEGGSRMKQRGETPRDGDPNSDNVIWGHTRLTDNHALIHFTMAHYLERFLSQPLQEAGVEMAFHKDYFLNAITDVLALEVASGEEPSDIALMWMAPRDQGGLGWLKETRINAFREVLSQQE